MKKKKQKKRAKKAAKKQAELDFGAEKERRQRMNIVGTSDLTGMILQNAGISSERVSPMLKSRTARMGEREGPTTPPNSNPNPNLSDLPEGRDVEDDDGERFSSDA